MHVLFHIDEEGPLSNTISDKAIEAAINFVEVCCQHTAYITGRANINQELDLVRAGILFVRLLYTLAMQKAVCYI